MTRLKIHSLGGARFLLDDAVFDRLSTRKVEALAIYIAFTRRSQPREILADMLWDDRSQKRAQSNLRVAITNLRKHLGSFFNITRNDISLNPNADVWLDAAELESLLSAAQSGEKEGGRLTASAAEQIIAAAALYHGEFLQGFHIRQARGFEEWLTIERERLHQLLLGGLDKLVAWRLERGEYTAGIEQARQWLSVDPLSELAHQQMMRLLAYSGQPGAALRQYQECLHLLDVELGLPPSEETTSLYEAIQNRSLAPPTQSSPAQISHQVELAEPVEQPAFLDTDVPQPSPRQESFVGREQELAIMEKQLAQALTGQGRLVFVSGEAGQGKTTLLREFARRTQGSHPDLIIARGACPVFTPVNAPYGIFREVLEMLTGDVESAWAAGNVSREEALRLWQLLPEMVDVLLRRGRNLVGPMVSAGGLILRASAASVDRNKLDRLNEISAQAADGDGRLSDQSELFAEYAAVLKAVSSRQPLLLLLDDLHWADAASIGLLGYLGHRLVEWDVLLVGAYRPEDVNQRREGEPHPLLPLLSEYKRRFGEALLALGEAPAGSGRLFVDALLDAEPNALDEAFRRPLAQHTGGHPLFTVELLRELQEQGMLQRNEENQWVASSDLAWDILPPRVEGVIETRINRLEPELRQWLNIASVEGETFTAEVIAHVQGGHEREVVKRLSGELDKQHRLVTAEGIRRLGSRRLSLYQFRHSLFRQFLYYHLDDIELSFLHEEVGETLEKLFEGRSNTIAARLAHHFQVAGNDEKAVHYLTQSAANAAQVYANEQAVKQYTEAIEAAERLPLEVPLLADLRLKRAPIFETLGAFERAKADYEEAVQMAQSVGRQRLVWQALLGLGKLWASRDYTKAGEYLEQALDLARQTGDPKMVASSLNQRGNWYANTNNLQRAIEIHEQALDIFQRLRDKQGMADTLDLSSWAYYYRGDYSASAACFDRAIALFRELDDRDGLASALANRGSMNAYYEYHPVISIDSLEESLPFLEESYQIAQEIGWRSQESYALWSLATRYFALGQFGRGIEAMREGLEIAHDLDHKYWITGETYDLGEMYNQLFAPEMARPLLNRALVLAGEIESQHFINMIYGALAKTYHLQNDLVRSRSYLENVVGSDSPMDSRSERYCWARWAELALAEGKPDVTLEVVDRLIATIPGLMPDRVISSLWRLRGEALIAAGHLDEAESVLQAALANAEAFAEHFHLWRIHATLGRLYRATNRRTEADNAMATARKLTEELAVTSSEQALRDDFLKGVSVLLESSEGSS